MASELPREITDPEDWIFCHVDVVACVEEGVKAFNNRLFTECGEQSDHIQPDKLPRGSYNMIMTFLIGLEHIADRIGVDFDVALADARNRVKHIL